MNIKLPALADAAGRLLNFVMTARHDGDYTSAAFPTPCRKRSGCWATEATNDRWQRRRSLAEIMVGCLPDRGRTRRDRGSIANFSALDATVTFRL